MKRQIVHISVHQTSKVISAMHTAMLTVLVILPSALGYLFHGEPLTALSFIILLPLFMWLFMYIGYVIACWFYNLVVPWTGGIEVEVAHPIGESKLETEKAAADLSSSEQINPSS